MKEIDRLKAQDLMKDMTLVVRIETGPLFVLRQWLGRSLLCLVARVLGCGIRFEE